MQTVVCRLSPVSARQLRRTRIKGIAKRCLVQKARTQEGLDEVVKEAIAQPRTRRRPVESRFLGQSAFLGSGERSRSGQDQERPFVSITFQRS